MHRVLIVDDCGGTRQAFAGVLRLQGFDTATAANGVEALAHASQHRFDVGLIDLNLPDMSGVDLIKSLRARGVYSPLVIVTAFPAVDSCFDAGSAGAAGYVDGPLFGDEISAVVRQALDGTRPVRHPARQDSSPQPGGGTHEQLRSPADERIIQVIRIVEAELPTRWSVEALAHRIGVSGSRLRHQFASAIGVPLSRFILECRLQRAACLFRSTGEAVQTVAERVGLGRDLRRFRRAFKARFGMSPSTYRAEFRDASERR